MKRITEGATDFFKSADEHETQLKQPSKIHGIPKSNTWSCFTSRKSDAKETAKQNRTDGQRRRVTSDEKINASNAARGDARARRGRVADQPIFG